MKLVWNGYLSDFEASDEPRGIVGYGTDSDQRVRSAILTQHKHLRWLSEMYLHRARFEFARYFQLLVEGGGLDEDFSFVLVDVYTPTNEVYALWVSHDFFHETTLPAYHSDEEIVAERARRDQLFEEADANPHRRTELAVKELSHPVQVGQPWPHRHEFLLRPDRMKVWDYHGTST